MCECAELRKRNNQKAALDGADAVVRVSIDGLSQEEALQALKQANLEALHHIHAVARAKNLLSPIAIKMVDSRDFLMIEMTERGVYRYANLAAKPEFLFYLIGEDIQGRKVSARIELVRQVIQ